QADQAGSDQRILRLREVFGRDVNDVSTAGSLNHPARRTLRNNGFHSSGGSIMLRVDVGIVMTALALSGCHAGSRAAVETRHETNSVDIGKVDTARVEINMNAGELHVKSGTPKLLEADFAYNVPEWKPVVDYRTNQSRGDLTISQPKSSGVSFRNTVYTWELKLTDQLPLDITAKLGAGEANLELGRMNLQHVAVNIGAGSLKVDLRGEPMRDYTVRAGADIHSNMLQVH